MKKRLVALTLVAAMALGMTACGSKSEGKISTNDTSANGTSHTAVSAGVDWTSYDELVDSIRTEADLAKRGEMMHQAEDMLMDTWCVIPLYYYNDQYMLKDYVTGVYSTVEGMKYFYNAKNTKNAGKLNIFMASEPDHIDPALNSTVDGGCLAVNSFEGLMRYNAEGKLEPACAESYEVSEDGLTYTFTMRDGLKWSDGTELNAKDFEYTFKRLTNTELAAPYAETVIGMVEGYQDAIGNPDKDGKPTTTPDPDKLNVVASEDGKTLTVKLAYPCSYFDKIVAFGTMSPVQKATVEANGDSWATKPDTYVCNGPYMITEWTPGESIVCKKNPNYKCGWDSKLIVNNKLTFLLLENSSASFTAYNSGEAQLIKDVPTEEIPTLKKAADGGDFYVDTILGTYYLSMNLNKAPFNNKNVRKALNLAIDRDYISNTIMQGTYSPPITMQVPALLITRVCSSITQLRKTAERPISARIIRLISRRLKRLSQRQDIPTVRASRPSPTQQTMQVTTRLLQSISRVLMLSSVSL